jgi:hypothetical protein
MIDQLQGWEVQGNETWLASCQQPWLRSQLTAARYEVYGESDGSHTRIAVSKRAESGRIAKRENCFR